MVIRLKKDPPKKYLFGAEAVAVKAEHDGPSARIAPPPRKISQVVPPNVPRCGRRGTASSAEAWR